MGAKQYKLPSAQASIALAIVGLAFFFIGYMLWMQDHTTSETRSQIEEMIKTHDMPSNKTTAMLDALDKTDKSNQTTFNILLPVFAAWVTAVVAFYFHTQVQSQSQQTINNLTSQITGQLSNMTINDLLKYYPDSKNIVTVKTTSIMNDVIPKCQQFGNVVVIDDTGKPLGIIYSSSLLSLALDNTALQSHFDKIIDPITNDPWSKKGSVDNFAQLALQDSVSYAKQQMDKIKPNDARIRGLVLDGGKVSNIVNYQMLTQPLSNQ